MVTGDFEKVDWSLKVMSRNTDTLTAELSDAVQNKGGMFILLFNRYFLQAFNIRYIRTPPDSAKITFFK